MINNKLYKVYINLYEYFSIYNSHKYFFSTLDMIIPFFLYENKLQLGENIQIWISFFFLRQIITFIIFLQIVQMLLCCHDSGIKWPNKIICNLWYICVYMIIKSLYGLSCLKDPTWCFIYICGEQFMLTAATKTINLLHSLSVTLIQVNDSHSTIYRRHNKYM